jgi:hypothetical protein
VSSTSIKQVPVTSIERFERLTPQRRRVYRRVLDAEAELSDARQKGDRVSASAVARKHHTSLPTMRRYLGSRVVQRRRPSGDRAGAVMSVIGTDGPRRLFVAGSRQRSLLGGHLGAIEAFPRDGGRLLRRYRGKTVTGIDLATRQRVRVTLEADPAAIRYWQKREPDHFLELYEDAA